MEATVDENGASDLGRNFPLAGTRWEFEGELIAGDFRGPGNAADFTLEFKRNGWFDFRADCRRGAGIYEIKGERIALAVIKANRITCHPGSQADELASLLEAARIFRLLESKLYFELKRQAKTLVFGQQP